MKAFANFDVDLFLRDFWQKKPLLIKSGLPDFSDPISPEELAGLALEPEIESRIVSHDGDQWSIAHGPFEACSFDRNDPWTLLVQSVDHLIDEVSSLREFVSFLPNWRFDDIMVSFAENGGGVGPHYDNYDVFLLQGQGSRTWRIGQRCTEDSELINHGELRILRDFEQSAEYTLESGDLLYVPPKVAHWGVADNPSLTYSLGFRAPPLSHMLSRATDELLAVGDHESFYEDQFVRRANRCGEIESVALDSAMEQLEAEIKKLRERRSWFGELVTESDLEFTSIALQRGDLVRLHPAARLAWSQSEDRLEVYANGSVLIANPELIESIISLCESKFVSVDEDLPLEFCLKLASCGCLSHE